MFKFVRRQDGGIVLEAAILLPLFLSFVLVLIMFIYMSLIELALQSAVSETVKTIATHAYPVHLLAEKMNHEKEKFLADSSLEQYFEKMKQVVPRSENDNSWPDSFLDNISPYMIELFDASKSKETLLNSLVPIVYHFSNQRILQKDRMKIVQLTLPDVTDREKSYLGIEVQYEFRLPVPFFNRTITLSKSAYERIWIGE
jgi:hypothetical protein